MPNPSPPITLDAGPLEFRRWLASLPQHRRLWRTRKQGLSDPFITWLRATVDPKATLVECFSADGAGGWWSDGWLDYRCHGQRDELPGWALWFLDYWRPEFTVAEGAAVFDRYIAERDSDFDGCYVEGYWDEFGPRPEVTGC